MLVVGDQAPYEEAAVSVEALFYLLKLDRFLVFFFQHKDLNVVVTADVYFVFLV